jgi:hypothetical protein
MILGHGQQNGTREFTWKRLDGACIAASIHPADSAGSNCD